MPKSTFKPWYELNSKQRVQAFNLDREVRETPSAFKYEIDQAGNVIGYQSLFEDE